VKPLTLTEVRYDDLVTRVHQLSSTRRPAHLHTTVPGCAMTGSARRAIVLEDSGEGSSFACFSDHPIEELAKPLAVLLHGAETVPADEEVLEPASAAVSKMAERMRLGKGHFHILNPACLANPHAGRWCIVFEDEEQGVLESVTAERPLADIRVVERLIYRP
jgi:hypothetical protein